MDLFHHVKRRTLFRAGQLSSFDRVLLDYSSRLTRYARGLYASEDSDITHTEALLYRTSHAIACLHSALWLNQILVEEPRPVRFAIDWKARRPSPAATVFETWRWKEPPHPEDVVSIRLQPHRPLVRAFTVAKSAVDLIRARERIGVSAAYDLADVLIGRFVDEDEVLECAARNRALRPVRQYFAKRTLD